MSRQIVACPSCKSRFDVSRFKPGSKIRCGSCYKILLIPDRPAEGAAPKPPSAAPPRVTPPPRPAVSQVKTTPGTRAPARPSTSPGTRPAGPRKPARSAVEARTGEQPVVGSDKDPLLGQKINDEFELVRTLGQGGYGTVYEGMDLTLKRQVAIKLMLREKTTNKEFVGKFLREARVAAQLNHPNIVRIHLVGFSKDLQQHFLAMEYVEGKTLSDLMAQDGAFSVEKAVDVIRQAANGLATAHSKNIIHRDIKPGNIMITPNGVVKITDFGLAKIYDPDAAVSTVIGTPYFMPPEQFEGKARDGRTDIYALGVTFYYLLTLRRPFEGRTPAEVLMKVLQQEPVSITEHDDKLPRELWIIIKKMIARNLDDRYSTCEELVRDLSEFQAPGGDGEHIYCRACGFRNSFEETSCRECRESLLEKCPQPDCGGENHVGDRFCGTCGFDLDQAKAVHGLLSEAQSHAATGRLEEALRKYREAREVSPENSAIVEGLRRTEQAIAERDGLIGTISELLEDGEFGEALAQAREASERFPENEDIANLAKRARSGARDTLLQASLDEARILYQAGDLPDACEAARRALEIDPDSGEARGILEESEGALSRHGEARDRASELEGERRLQEALEAWKEALSILPGDEAALQAVTRIEGVLEQLGRLRSRAEEALEERDLARARSALEDAVGVLPSDSETRTLLDRLRGEETELCRGLSGALELLAEGRYEEGGNSLRQLALAFPREDRITVTAERASRLMEIGEGFLADARALLDARRTEIAVQFAHAARRISPHDQRVEALLAEAKTRKRDQLSSLAEVRRHMDRHEYKKAASILDAFGGVGCADEEVAALARRAADGIMVSEKPGADKSREVLSVALRTATELFRAGRTQAALAACQKALRLDRTHEEALALKREIDTVLADSGQAQADSKIETAFFNVEGVVEDD